MLGYQGWFSCPGDIPGRPWSHWSTDPGAQRLTVANLAVPMWPDLSEFDEEDLCPTDMKSYVGRPVRVFSSAHPAVIRRHMSWLRRYDLDGVFLQRFLVSITGPAKDHRDRVLAGVRAAAEEQGRVFAVMYDLSGYWGPDLVDVLWSDWVELVESSSLLESPAYLHHRGRPLVAIWGFGFADRPGSPAEAMRLIERFHGPGPFQATLLGGVPTRWRTLGDEQQDPAWAKVYRSFDVLSPWTVGRWRSPEGARDYVAETLAADMDEAQRLDLDVLPVLWPGFVVPNRAPVEIINLIPRRRGEMLWEQVVAVIEAGAPSLYLAMFDELDEGTALFKVAPTVLDVPLGMHPLVTLASEEGDALSADAYLRLAGWAGKMLRGEEPLRAAVPLP